MNANIDDVTIKAKLLGSLLLFTQTFYKLRTGREFEVSEPIGRESHHITICKSLTKVFRGEYQDTAIEVPPRYGKTELIIHFVAWALAHYADCNFIYISYAHALAKKQTQTIREIIMLPWYRKIFGVEVKQDSSAKDNFETTVGGSVYAAGAGGTITGRGAGIQNCMRFGGAAILDDMHKPAEATSDTIRQSVIDWDKNTLQSRFNSPLTPKIFIGQRVHEDDLPAHYHATGRYHTVIIPALDGAGNALNPKMHTRETLLRMKEETPYEFASQYQQDPQPAGGGIYKKEWYVLLDEEPEMLATFITVDTAETDKSYNDATVFSFWGIYKIKEAGVDVDLMGLHWINCLEIRVEPKDLEPEFRQFYASCLRHPVKPKLLGIEKKSTGATLLSLLGNFRGVQIVDIPRTKATGSKTARFLEAQPYVASKRISLMKYDNHTEKCITHMSKITANDTHAHDDIADTHYDAIKMGLIDDYVLRGTIGTQKVDVAGLVASKFNKLQTLKKQAYNYGR